jgi:hypothetical protein
MRASILSLALAAAFAASADAQVYINEIYYDATGTDDGKTFIEIYGPPTLDISGWELRSIEGTQNTTPGLGCGFLNQTGTIILPPGSIIGPDGFFVVADGIGGVTQVVCPPTHNGGLPDLIVNNADWENGPDEAVQLLAPPGFLLDAVWISGNGLPLPCTTDADFGFPIGYGTPCPDVFGGFSLERYPAGTFSGDNSVDLHIQGRPSPGYSARPAAMIFDLGGLSASGGGTVNLSLDFALGANKPYLVLASITAPVGNEPLGVPFDPITNIFLTFATTPNPIVVNFAGNLDANGQAVATFALPAGLVSLTQTVPFYFCAISPVSAIGSKTNVSTIYLNP